MSPIRYQIPSIVLLISVCMCAGSPAAQKIDPKVRAKARAGELIPVHILLTQQPQAEIYDRVAARHAVRLAMSQERVKRVAEAASSTETDFKNAAAERDAVLFDIRREALVEIDQAIGPAQDAMQARLLGMGAKNIQRLNAWNMITAEIPSAAIDSLERDDLVAQVSMVEAMPATGALSLIPMVADATNGNKDLDAIHVDAFWDGSPVLTGVGQSVAVLDSGLSNLAAFTDPTGVLGNLMSPSMVFLTNARTSTYRGSSPNPPHTYAQCFAANTDNSQDQIGHGTEVASVVASRQAAYYGVAKGLPTLFNLKVVAAKNFPNCYSDNFRDVVAALNWASNSTGNRIFNFSTGSPTTQGYDIEAQTFDRFVDGSHFSIVTVAGEDPQGHAVGAGTIHSPGTAYDVITVGAWDTGHGGVADWSGKGKTVDGRKKPDLVAPGVNIQVAAVPTGSTVASGTSLAAPFVTGTLALLAQMGITDQLQAKALLIDSADRPQGPEWHEDSGWGYLNLQNLRQQTAYSSINTLTPQQTYSFFTGPGEQSTPSIVALNATVTWNRHFAAAYPTGFLNNLDLFGYGKDSGSRIATSDSTIDNVEFVNYTEIGDAVLKVKQIGAWQGNQTSEKYALAVSLPGYRPAMGPGLSITCPTGAQDLSKPWTCTVTNTGDLPAFNVTVTRNGGDMQAAGTIQNGKSGTASWMLPAGGGTETMLVQSTSYDEQFTAKGTFSVTSVSACPTPTMTPSGTLSVPASGGTYTLQISGLPDSCTWTDNVLNNLWNVTVLTYLNDNYISVTVPVNGAEARSIQIQAYSYPKVQNDLPLNPPVTLTINQAELPYTLQGGVTLPLPPAGIGGGLPGVTIHFQLISGTGAPPADVVTDQNGNWSATGFSWGYVFGQPATSASTYSATPSRAGYTFTPTHYEHGGQANPNFDSSYFTATPVK